jgi:hypothetical protein
MTRWAVLLPTFDPLRAGGAPRVVEVARVAAGVDEFVLMALGSEPLRQLEQLAEVRDAVSGQVLAGVRSGSGSSST